MQATFTFEDNLLSLNLGRVYVGEGGGGVGVWGKGPVKGGGPGPSYAADESILGSTLSLFTQNVVSTSTHTG